MTTNFARSKPMWRSINGSVPLPIEPKPSITIEPSKRACSGQAVVALVMAFIFVVPSAIRKVCLSRVPCRRAAGRARNASGEARLRCRTAGCADQAACAIKAAGLQFAAEQPWPLETSGQPERAGLGRGKAEAVVIGRIADKEEGIVATSTRDA